MSAAFDLTDHRQKQARVFAQHADAWYVEPISATADLLRYERFNGLTWDPACGGGNVCEAFKRAGMHCIGTDIVQRRQGVVWWGGIRDFLADPWSPFGPVNVVTNPPFFRAKGTEAFIRRALAGAIGKVAIFADIKFLASAGRATGLFAEHCPHRVWVIAKRPSCPPGEYLAAGNKAAGGTADWRWMVWDQTAPATRTYQGGWILPGNGRRMTDAYRDFLRSKIRRAEKSGFVVDPASLSAGLKPHTAAIVRWAVAGGRRAIFASFGLHKTRTQLEILRVILLRYGGRALIIAPLGVRQEFFRDAGILGIPLRFIRRIEDAEPTGIHITNYEPVRDGKLDPNAFLAVTLDEASVLRSYVSKTFQTFLALFEKVRFRFVATATPSPNRFKELIHYAGFLGVMDTGQALTRFFQRNSEKANDLTLYPHKEEEFWLWIASWAVVLQKPSDLGFSDEGYEQPPLIVRWHEVPSDLRGGESRDGQVEMFRPDATGLSVEARERRATLPARIAVAKAIIDAAPADHFIVWHDLEAERHAIDAAIPEARSVYGTQDLDERENRIVAFSDGAFRVLSAKPIIAGSGCNFQRHCHRAVFAGIGHKFNDFIQAIHRVQRFGQDHPVEIDIIHSEADRAVRRDLEAKWAQHEEMAARMSDIIRKFGLNDEAMAEVLTRSLGVERLESHGERWRLVNNDCVDETKTWPENSIDLIVTSIPFANHYEYTPSYNDFGHTEDNAQFFAQMDHLTPELVRVLKPGRLACIHVKDRVLFGSVTGEGVPTVDPFHAECIMHYRRHGLQFMGMIHVNTDVVRENNQTYRLGYTEMLKDSTKMGVGCPEYVLLLRKQQSNRGKGYADQRVVKTEAEYPLSRWQIDAHAFWRSSGERLLTADEVVALPDLVRAKLFTEATLKHVYDFDWHLKIGRELEIKGKMPVTYMSLAPGATDPNTWHDVHRMLTLNTAQASAGREKHVCPMQFDIVDRLITRYSMKDELIFDPFAGIGTVPFRAVKLGRRGCGIELSAGYFLDACGYLKAEEARQAVPSLFDLLPESAAA